MIYIRSYSQISNQEPLTGNWFDLPVPCRGRHCRSIDASYNTYIPPMVARRMGVLLKRAVVTSVTALKDAGIEIPDAILCGSGLGCIENTEKFLSAMIENNESCLQPTFFINSTHNTIASQVATFTKCHGYNNTYAHLGISFESALMDALMQFELGRISNALVCGNDEMTPTFFRLFDKVGFWGTGSVPGPSAGESSVAMILSDEPGGHHLCRLEDVMLRSLRPIADIEASLRRFLESNSITPDEIDLIVTGRTGEMKTDAAYDALVGGVFGESKAQAHYKHIFGDCFTSGAYGVALGSEAASRGYIPEVWMCGAVKPSRLDNILVINSFRSDDWAFILLRK